MSDHTINVGRGNTAISPSRSKMMQQSLISSSTIPSSTNTATPNSAVSSLALFPGAPRPFSKTRNVVVLGGAAVGKEEKQTKERKISCFAHHMMNVLFSHYRV